MNSITHANASILEMIKSYKHDHQTHMCASYYECHQDEDEKL